MSYSPTLGRFMERDPIGDVVSRAGGLEKLAVTTNAMAPVTANAVAGAFDSASSRFGLNAIMKNPQLLQYARGMNSYEFVSSSPAAHTDPSGLDRYVGSESRLHYYIVVDNWELTKNKDGCPCWKKTGETRYDFSLWRPTSTGRGNEATAEGAFTVINIVGALTFSGTGNVESQPYTGTPHYTIPSGPEADQFLTNEMQQMSANPPNYHALFYNCNWWVENWKNEGITQTAGKKTFPVCP